MREEYKIINSDSSHELAGNVQAYLNDGWFLCGGVATGIKNPHGEIPTMIYCQALHRRITTA